MKLILSISIGILLLVVLLPFFLLRGRAPIEPPADTMDEPPPITAPPPVSLLPPIPGDGLDDRLMLQVLLGDTIHTMSMRDYLIGVVAAEMPASFHAEALKAQAVAARTYTLHRMLVAPAARHPDAYVCGDYSCCKAYHSTERLQERWGEQFYAHRRTIESAIAATDGIILLYENRPILAAFHAASYGYTEASGSLWNPVPYLQSVRSFEGVSEVPNFYYTVTHTFHAFRDIVQAQHPTAHLPDGDEAAWISNVIHTPSGRLAELSVGGVTLTGAQFRSLFGLRATMVQFSFDATSITLTTGGHGHGVGMSQFGANTKATIGLSFDAILQWYYTNVTLALLDDLFVSQADAPS